MSWKDYQHSRTIAAEGHTFEALIMAAMRVAETSDLKILVNAFPKLFKEFEKRYDSILGFIETDPEMKEHNEKNTHTV